MDTPVTPKLTFDEFAVRYCERQESTPANLLTTFKQMREKYKPVGFFLAEAQLMDSSYFGSLVALPYGPDNTFKEVPDHPFSPRGLASDTSVAVAHCPASELPDEAAPWEAPPPSPKPKKKRRKS